MSIRSFEEQFRDSAGFLVHMLDAGNDRVLVLALAEAAYKEASFLDQRILTPDRPRQWLPWDEIAGFAGNLDDSADFIFHVGHVGSTLISRLLGELPSVLAVREPLVLRSFAELYFACERPESPWAPSIVADRLKIALGWLSRSFRPGQRAMIKASSFASSLAAAINRPGRRCLFLYSRPQAYIETILAGEASRQELTALSPARLVRLHSRLGEEPWRLWQLSTGEQTAMAWASEMTALELASSEPHGGAVLWTEFDRLLAAPSPGLVRIAAHFQHELSDMDADRLVSGPIMHSYSKAPELEYSPALRQNVRAESRLQNREEIDRGLRWLEGAAFRYPLIESALNRATRGD